MKKILVLLMSAFALTQCDSGAKENRTTVHYEMYRKLKPKLPLYVANQNPLKIQNLHMLGEVGPNGVDGWQGKILRGFRFKDAANAVEDRYNLPHNLVLAMLIHETSGVDLLPNGGGDGGFGICHMQGSAATRFGLKTYDNCTSLVCNGTNEGRRGSCKRKGQFVDHATSLHNLIKKERFVRPNLVKYDERLHPLYCLDAVGRMIAEGMDKPPTNSFLSSVGPLQRAMYRYSGRKEYWGKITHIMRLLENKKFLAQLRTDFDKINPQMTINGQKANYDLYVSLMQKDLENYGLKEYKKLPKYQPRNSVAVQKTYRKFVFGN